MHHPFNDACAPSLPYLELQWGESNSDRSISRTGSSSGGGSSNGGSCNECRSSMESLDMESLDSISTGRMVYYRVMTRVFHLCLLQKAGYFSHGHDRCHSINTVVCADMTSLGIVTGHVSGNGRKVTGMDIAGMRT